jgi:hypothetical protein
MTPTVPGLPDGGGPALGAPAPGRPTPGWPTPGWPTPGIAFGGDHNPEQWPEDIWDEDVALMRDAGVTVLTVAVFPCAGLQPAPGGWDDEWLQRILDLLHRNGIAVDLATATASPPPWLVRAHPEIRPVDARGTRLEIGSRQTWCPSSPVFREHSLNLVREVAGRFGDHPAVVMWARVQRIGRPQRQLPLRRQRHSFPGVAPGQMRGAPRARWARRRRGARAGAACRPSRRHRRRGGHGASRNCGPVLAVRDQPFGREHHPAGPGTPTWSRTPRSMANGGRPPVGTP